VPGVSPDPGARDTGLTMKTLTSFKPFVAFVGLTPLALIIGLSACGDDPITLAEIIAGQGSANAEPSAPGEPLDDQPVPQTPPEVPADDPEPSDPETNSDEAAVIAILVEHCAACHEGEGVSPPEAITDIDQLIEDGDIVPGNREDSPLYARMLSGTMPPAFVVPRVSSEDIERVGAFIDTL
jgi:mono/diheme cytochrome c family protein